MEGGTGFPGYNTLMPKSVGTFSEVLRQSGYNTAWYGKNHNIPDWHNSQAGPFDLWPTGLGFEYFYGFIGGDTSQWAPAIFEGVKPIEPPHDDKDYFFEKDMADKAIERIRLLNALAARQAVGDLLCARHGARSAPRPEGLDRLDRGPVRSGLGQRPRGNSGSPETQGIVPQDTQLTERSEGIPAWDSLDADHKRVAAHMMEVYAAALSYCELVDGPRRRRDCRHGQARQHVDHLHPGRQWRERRRRPAETSSTRSRSTTPSRKISAKSCAAWTTSVARQRSTITRSDWAHAMDTPFQWDEADRLSLRRHAQRHGHLVARPHQGQGRRPHPVPPCHRHRADHPRSRRRANAGNAQWRAAEAHRGREHGLFIRRSEGGFDPAYAILEMFANRAIYNDGWVAATTLPLAPWASGKTIPVDDYKWELYDITSDFSQANNLAAKEPQKLREMQELFWIEAARNNVLPLDNSKLERMNVDNRPSLDLRSRIVHLQSRNDAQSRRQRA